MRLSTRSSFRRTPQTDMHNMRRSHRTRDAVSLAAVLAVSTLSFSSLLLPASAADSGGSFEVLAKDRAGNTASAGIATVLVDPGSGGSTGNEPGGSGTAAPSTAAQFMLNGVSTNYFTRKSNTAGSEQPSIVIPGFSLDGSSLSTPRDWKIIIPKSQDPFGFETVYKNGLPGWAKISESADSFTISNVEGTMQLGGANRTLSIGQLEFNYTPRVYAASQTVAEGSMASGSSSNMNLKVSTVDSKAFSYGRWSTTLDISALRAQLGNPSGELSLNSSVTSADPGFSLTKLSDSRYTIGYNGSNQNRYIKGVDAVSKTGEDTSTGYTVVSGLLTLAPPSASSNQVSNADGTVTLELTQSNRTVSARYVKLPPASTPWTIDLDLSKLVAIDRTKTPVVYNTQFALTKKSGDVYTLAYNGKGSPTVGGSGSAGQVDIQLPW